MLRAKRGLTGMSPFLHKSLEPAKPTPSRKLSHYITKLTFAAPYTKVKSFPFRFLKTDRKKKNLSKGRKHSSYNYNLDSCKLCCSPEFADMPISCDYLENSANLRNEMVRLLSTEAIAFMLDGFA